ncbi:exocyst complex component Sec3-domain-containing protein [Radiomyces spectabilis]|uniref:exocyst complex component Sec3-domain-containing protein n=1 Tax=Radiomyces spectabilis TaxID=64574 RepID=UPI00221EDF28|nr:exocyst complex component Sec3-domain-containing protein [Radiomyces spectabilis]KAI8364634.1 exocyst complex component Sec3-domain-containing protein [Radiomyces spectabilis]
MPTDVVRQAIISSLFPTDAGENLLIHLKVFEDVKQTVQAEDDGNAKAPNIMGKPRYLCLTQKRNRFRLYKVKRNQTGTFSAVKSWLLDDIKQIEIIDANQFAMTLNKYYLWAVEKPKDKNIFLAYLIQTARRVLTKVPKLVNIDENYLLRFLHTSPNAGSSSPATASSPSSAPRSEDIRSYSAISSSGSQNHLQSPVESVNREGSVHENNIPRSGSFADNLLPRNSPAVSSDIQPSPSERSRSDISHLSSNHDTPTPTKEIERKEQERLRDAKREREKRDKKVQEEKAQQKKAIEMQDKLAEQASLMNVEELLTDFNWKTSGNAAALEKRLLGELHALEAANVHAIIQSDERVRSVIEHIDVALEELDTMDRWLLLYSTELNSMGDDIRKIESQNRGLQILTANQHDLIEELDKLLSAITIPKSCLESLKYDSMDTAEDVEKIQQSAESLRRVLKIKLDAGMQDMTAVQERLAMYIVHSNNFSSRIYDFLRAQFDQQAHIAKEMKARASPTSTRKGGNLTVQPHDTVVDALIKYQGFNLWEKEMEPRMYNELQRVWPWRVWVTLDKFINCILQHYAQSMAPVYEMDIRELIDATRVYYTTLRNRGLEELEYIFRSEDYRTARALAPYAAKLSGDDNRTHRYRHMLRGSMEGVMGGSGNSSRNSIDEDEKAADEAFAQLMSQSIMLVTREQNFMSDLFQLSLGAPSSFLERGPVIPKIWNKSDLYLRRDKNRDVKVSKKILNWIEIIFETLEPSLVSLLEYGVKSDPTQSVSMLAAAEFQHEKWEDSDQVFVSRLCTSLMQRLARTFGRFISEQLKIIEETKVSSKKRKGILPFFRTFPIFALRLEAAAANVDPESETRKTVNDAYEKIINGMMASLDSIAKESDQTGDDKEQLNANIMYIENMHHFYHELRANKLHVLDKWTKIAKSQYDSSLNAYIKVIIRRPLGKLLEFFEGVEAMMRTSTPEEVSFHINYNKAQLRRVIAMYPAKEIKKSLEQLYKRVDKHFSEEEGLLQVVWRGIQEEFLRQHEKMEELIQRCYPDAGIHLEFTVQDLLAMMSELARKVNV